MDGSTPTGNQWNFDHDNRKKYKVKFQFRWKNFNADVTEVVSKIKEAGILTFGNIDEKKLVGPLLENNHYKFWIISVIIY
jgi:deoxyribodipyrimidine photolyase-related protein